MKWSCHTNNDIWNFWFVNRVINYLFVALSLQISIIFLLLFLQLWIRKCFKLVLQIDRLYYYLKVFTSKLYCSFQQPNHPTYFALSRLESCMYNVYTRLAVPDVPRQELEPGLVCAANWSQQWYRGQVSKMNFL